MPTGVSTSPQDNPEREKYRRAVTRNRPKIGSKHLAAQICVAFGLLSACATPARMHTDAELNAVATGCGLALGELIQDEEQKKLLLMIHQDPSFEQRVCVAKWARRNGLKAVFVTMKFPEG